MMAILRSYRFLCWEGRPAIGVFNQGGRSGLSRTGMSNVNDACGSILPNSNACVLLSSRNDEVIRGGVVRFRL